MSKRRRSSRKSISRKPSRQSTASILAAELASSVPMAADGYTNPTAFLGEASGLFSSGTFVRSGLTQNTSLLTTLYREYTVRLLSVIS